jgi:hypothetical protein
MDEYDDFRVTFSARSDGRYDVIAVAPEGSLSSGVFRMPFSEAELSKRVLRFAAGHHEARTPRTSAPEPSADLRRGRAARDIGRQVELREAGAKELGGRLAEALFAVGHIGDAFRESHRRACANGRGLRLSLSLAAAPALLNVPWEFLFDRPRFLAASPTTPVVRVSNAEPRRNLAAPAVTTPLRVLAVISNPTNLPPLDVSDERRRIELALQDIRDLVEVDWLVPASPKRLQHALLDGRYHILHYIGHSHFTGEVGVLYLEGDDGRAVPVDETTFATLLAAHLDRQLLRLVVLNSCDGARTTVGDPFAGIAATLVHLGMPAVVAMQYEISDVASRVFAECLYGCLIQRQMPIEGAVAAARKAILLEGNSLEWATPVLFLRDPDVELFRFAPPPTHPMDINHESAAQGHLRPKRNPTRALRHRLRRLFE